MDNQQTPETDGAEIIFSPLEGDAWVPASISRKLERERDEARAERDILRLDAQREAEQHDRMVGELEKVYAERDEARQRASDLALGVKVADCMYDYGKYSVALREAKIKARYLQELTRAAYDEVEKLEDQEATL
jgi:hypothetical protein